MGNNIILSAGGTGGHLFPAITIGEELLAFDYRICLITDIRGYKYLNQNLKLNLYIIDIIINNNNIFKCIKSIFSIIIATCKAVCLLHKLKPSIIIGFGGYPTFPVLLAALMLRIPIVLHEQNSLVGKVNRFFMRFAKIIALSYPETKIPCKMMNKSIITGDIIRKNIKNITIKKNFDHSPFRIFIFGGSQGAKIFSNLIPDAIKLLLEQNPHIALSITQQVIKEDYQKLSEIYSKLHIPYQLSEFFYNIAQQYETSELVIARAGASTIAELTYIGMPTIFIPLPSAAENHQFHNAQILQNNMAAWCFEQKTLKAQMLADQILELINNRDLLRNASMHLLKRKNNNNKILTDTIRKIIS
jgi:UDP-N-acetylglucosamine--N-acetylmuramyl-(pentapeptide) pyrophosphoryl-undecaprenol N-acetylglucosamine transferase